MDVLKVQEECFNNIKTLCVNYGKDGKSRKTEDYLHSRIQALELQWKDFEQRHATLMTTVEDKDIKYFTEDVFGKTNKLYLTTKQDMDNLLLQLREEKPTYFDLSGISDESTDEHLKKLLDRQECNFKALDRAMSKVDLETITQKWELEDHLSILKSKWDVIDRHHWELEAILKGSNSQYYSMFVSIEDKYDELRRSLNTKIWSTVHYQKSAPKIEIPEFSGSYTQWISFKDLFLETIHNNPMINKAQKMQHLKTRLRGEAERLVQHLSISAENYNSCWDILTQRYDNHRLQFTSFINTMLNMPAIHQPDGYNLKKLHDVITECMNGLTNIGINTSTWDPLIVHLMSQKLDTVTYTDYMKELQDHRELPHLHQFLFFVESKFMAYESMKNAKRDLLPQKQASMKTYGKPFSTKKPVQKTYTKTYHTTFGQCPHCDGSHVLMQCPKFMDMNSIQRNNIVAKLCLCKNCLYSHGNANCSSTKTCKECNKRHHTLLHNSAKKRPTSVFGERENASTSTQPSSNHLATSGMEILLTTVQLQIKNANGTWVTLRALLDQGSQVNLVTEQAAQLLRLPRKRLNATISGVGTLSGDCKGRIQLSCKSIHSDYTFTTDALIMKKLTNNLPSISFEKGRWPHLQNLKFADPEFNESRPVDLLLGADIYSDIILDGVLKGSPQSPIAQQTQLGWILCGKMKTFNCHVVLFDLNNITKFWESEDITQNVEDIPNADQCEKHYSETVQRSQDGKFIVKMPFVPNFEEKVGKSRSTAISQFLQLEKRLQKNQKLALMYRDFMNEYMELQHMTPAHPINADVPEFYLPHHGVLREHSATTKLRVVFNASQKTSSGLSLNHLQEKGPNLQKDIQALMLKWRYYRYAYTADIEKMYRCIWIASEQQQLQKIIWRHSSTEKLQTYQLRTLTYGMSCAPWIAMRTLKQLAIEDGNKYPEAATVLQNAFYVDDVICGHSTIEAAKHLQTSLIKLLKGGGMNLRKWSANNPVLLENLSEDQISTQQVFDFRDEETKKTLGLGWNTKDDTFTFYWDIEKCTKHPLTKRRLLSEISKLYDPLGWLAPITVAAKLLFQKVWTSKLTWDETLPTEMQDKWQSLKNELVEIRAYNIPRWLGGITKNIELLGFCDASEKAYACVVYSRVINEHGLPVITLLAAKTRVAPKAQKITLPRLELGGASLLSQLVEKAQEAFRGFHVTVRAWSDSQVVLAWLQGDASRWERYVANRVNKIKQVIPSENWFYVRSEMNPADCASRGLSPAKLRTFKLWWKGPEFLQNSEKEIENKKICLHTTNIALKPKVTTLPINDNNNTHFINELVNNNSSLARVTRITAWVLRFSANIRNLAKSNTAYLTTRELAEANKQIIKFIQGLEFEQDYKSLLKKESVSNKSPIYKLNPYLDMDGILRVGGRLNKSNLPSDMKNPMILSRNGRLTQLLIDQAHSTTLHGGARLTLAYIRQRYWIVGGNRAVKTRLRHCIRCHRHKPTETYQLMSDLPQHRITPSRPFTHTGVDFTGHVDVKLNKGRGVKTSKGYIAVFVCMATKAVHIELVSDLSTDSFVAAFQRLCARRGTPKHVYSDCGTNFIGAAKVLRKEFEEFRQLLSPEFFTEIGKLEVEWHFNVPAWPSAGGLWESAVKSLKHHLRRVLGEQKLTYEEFATLLSKIEACMNSRPLCPLTEDPEEFYNVLTPGHFLTGGPVLLLPLSDHSEVRNIDLRRRWQLTENMLQQFWKSWSNEYLTQLQSRSKWNKVTKNIEKGSIVLIRDNNLPPGKWAMGRVIELHPGSDGLVRVTTVKTQTGIIKRPIVKLSVLPMESETDNKPEAKPPATSHTAPITNSEKKKPVKTKKTFTSLLTTIITILALITGTYATGGTNLTSSAHIANIEPDRPIYYDTLGKLQIIHDEWTLLMYYNLTNYWVGLQRVDCYLEHLKDVCRRTDPRYCETTLQQLSHEMDLLHHYNSILLAPHKHLSERKKRGVFDGIGYVANRLFGVLDQEFAEKYHQDIEEIHKNENYLLELVKNQTSIVELENKVLKKTEENIHQQLKAIDGFINETNYNLAHIESNMEIMMATSYFNSASLSTYLLLKNLKEMQELLFDTLTNVYKGHMDVHLLSPVELKNQLSVISGRLPKTLTLPVDNPRDDIKDIYKLLYVKARVTSNYFLFEVHVPLTSDEDFLLYKITPLPVKTGEEFNIIQTKSPYIAVNFQQNTFISPFEADIKQCTILNQARYVCNKNIPVYNLQNKNAPCEAKLLSHRSSTPCDVRKTSCRDEWIELHTPNTWLAICCGTCTLRTICQNDITAHELTSSGIVVLMQGCVLQSNDFTIYSHNEYNSNMQLEYDFNTPPLNSTVNKIVSLTHHYTNIPQPHDVALAKDIENVERRLLSQKEREVFPTTISSHDTHQYIICYTLLGVAIIAAIVWSVKRYRPCYCSRKRNKRPEEPRHEEIELHHLERGGQPTSDQATTAQARRGEPPLPRSTQRDNIAFNFD